MNAINYRIKGEIFLELNDVGIMYIFMYIYASPITVIAFETVASVFSLISISIQRTHRQ